ncbi:MAG: phage tail protein [Clostridia bacterium]|nr:phage tail protein [Clostridia bacterium]
MPGIQIEINQSQIDHVNKMLYTLPNQAKAVFRNSINRGLVAARTQAAKEIRERYDIKTGNVKANQTIRLKRAEQTGSDIVGEISFSGTKIPLYKFHPSPSARRYTNRYVNGVSGWRVTTAVSAADIREKGMVQRPKGFIATFQSGHTGIFRRTSGKTSTGKTKLKEYWGPAVADMLDYPEARESVQNRASEMVAKRLDQELYRVLSSL